MEKPSVIVFDLGNVLLPFDYNIILTKLNKIEKNLGDKFEQFYYNNYEIHRKYESGKITSKEFVSVILKWTDKKLTGEQFCMLYSKIFRLNKNVAALLPKLKKKNYKLVLLSNTSYIHRKYGWQHYSFLKYFDKLILSYKVGANKPEEKIYKAAENFTKAPSSKHLFIDDVKEYVEGAKKLGWDGIQFKNYEQLVKELERRKIL
jgi:glucose-1-phosphatase